MSEKLSCHVVKDLLPLYVDGLTGSETAEDIKAHLDGCEECSREYAAMTGAEEAVQQDQKEQSEAQIDYLKKVKKRSKRAALAVGCAALAVLLLLALRLLFIGKTDLRLNITASVSAENPKEVTITAMTMDSALGVSGIKVSEEDGVLTVTGRTVLTGIHKNTFSTTYTASSEVRQIVDIAGRVLWENGLAINPYVSELYSRKVKYVGDASKVNELKRAIWTPATDMPYGPLELRTSSEPYGVIITIGTEDMVQSVRYREYIMNVVERHACWMLALVENLGYAEYNVYTGQKDASGAAEVITIRVTADRAFEIAKSYAAELPPSNGSAQYVLAAQSIKDFAGSAYACEMLDNVLMTGPASQIVTDW